MLRDFESIQQATTVFRALSDPTRLKIVGLLSEQPEVFQKRLVQEVGAGQSSVSRHLSYLRRAGLVAQRRGGRYVYWRLQALPAPIIALLRRLIGSAPGDMVGPAGNWEPVEAAA